MLALSPSIFRFALEYAIRKVQVNQDGLKLIGTHQLLLYADDVNVLGGSVHTINENAEALVAASNKTGLEVYADKTKYSRTPHIWIANYLDWLGSADKPVNNAPKPTCPEITGYQIKHSRVLWLLQLQIRCGQNVET